MMASDIRVGVIWGGGVTRGWVGRHMSQWAHCMMASDIRVGVIWGGE